MHTKCQWYGFSAFQRDSYSVSQSISNKHNNCRLAFFGFLLLSNYPQREKMFQFTLSLAWSLMHAFKWKRAFSLLFFFSSFNRKMKSPNHTFMEYSYFFSLLVRNHSGIEIYLPKKWNVEFIFRYPLGESNELNEKICWCVEMKRVYEIRAKIEKKITHTNFFFG